MVMKAGFVMLLLCQCVANSTCAQIAYGLKGGLNFADIVITNYVNADAESDFDLKTGVHAGMFANLEISEKFLLSGELLYSNRGVKAITNINLHYVDLVLLGKYRITDKFLGELGGQTGYLFAAKSGYGDVSNTWNNKLDIGLDLGLQYDFGKMISAGLRYYAGFSSVIDVRDESNSNTPGEKIKYQNRLLQLSVCVTVGRKDL
jgi:hypothetical protein